MKKNETLKDNFLAARGIYRAAKELAESRDRKFEEDNQIPEDASSEFFDDWAERSVDFSYVVYEKLERAEKALIDATSECLKSEQLGKWNEIKELFLDGVSGVLASSDIIELALKMEV